jgi:hypothetical protein
MGFRDKHWAKIKSDAIIGAMVQVAPCIWKVIKISHEEETVFTKALERACKTLDVALKYIVVRIQPENEEIVTSWFFIHDFIIVPKQLDKYINQDSKTILSAEQLKSILEKLFLTNVHPQQRVRKYTTSRKLERDLTLLRMETLIKMARQEDEHPLVDGVSQRDKFATKLARFIKADRPLIYHLKLQPVFLMLNDLRRRKEIITYNEIIAVITKLLEGHDWKTERIYLGLPVRGTERDQREGKFITYRGKHTALSVFVDNESASEWDLGEVIETGEEFLD